MQNCDFQKTEASKIDTTIKYDFVISHSVFHYYKELDYAEGIIKKMLLKLTKSIAIFDINDYLKKSEHHEIRKGKMDNQE